MTPPSSFFTRWRVRLGYPLAIAVLFFARPAPRAIVWGALVGILGLLIRAWAAGFLRKQEVLTVSGPYAHTRNPLYFGSAILSCGLAVATNSWVSAALIAAYFTMFYAVVMHREAADLRGKFGAAFDDYAHSVPLFFPRLTAAPAPLGTESGDFSRAQYCKNREYRAAIGFALLLAFLLLLWYLRRG